MHKTDNRSTSRAGFSMTMVVQAGAQTRFSARSGARYVGGPFPVEWITRSTSPTGNPAFINTLTTLRAAAVSINGPEGLGLQFSTTSQPFTECSVTPSGTRGPT
jgi:hypothetical protein